EGRSAATARAVTAAAMDYNPLDDEPAESSERLGRIEHRGASSTAERKRPRLFACAAGAPGGAGARQPGARDAETEHAGRMRRGRRGGSPEIYLSGSVRPVAGWHRAVVGSGAGSGNRARRAAAVGESCAGSATIGDGSQVAGFSQLLGGFAAGGGLRISIAGASSCAERALAEARSGGAAKRGGGTGVLSHNYAGLQQLAAIQRDGGDGAGDDGGAVGRHADRLRHPQAQRVVRGRRDVRRWTAVPLGLLQQLRHSTDAAGYAAEYQRA